MLRLAEEAAGEERGSFVGRKKDQRWRWHAIEPRRGQGGLGCGASPGRGVSAAQSLAGAVWHPAFLYGCLGRVHAPYRLG
jgi:hypothetical protein